VIGFEPSIKRWNDESTEQECDAKLLAPMRSPPWNLPGNNERAEKLFFLSKTA
jgi:hypothetical protein